MVKRIVEYEWVADHHISRWVVTKDAIVGEETTHPSCVLPAITDSSAENIQQEQQYMICRFHSLHQLLIDLDKWLERSNYEDSAFRAREAHASVEMAKESYLRVSRKRLSTLLNLNK